MRKRKNAKFQQALGISILVVSIAKMCILVLRLPQIIMLMEVFEEFGKIPNKLIGTQMYVAKELLVNLFGMVLGEYLRIQKYALISLVIIACSMFLLWQIYRVCIEAIVVISS